MTVSPKRLVFFQIFSPEEIDIHIKICSALSKQGGCAAGTAKGERQRTKEFL